MNNQCRAGARAVLAVMMLTIPAVSDTQVKVNCAYNAISTLARKPYGQIVPSPGVPDMMRDIVDECLSVATAEGFTVPGDVEAAVWRIVETIPQQYSSTAQDILRGKSTEIDYLNGHIVRRGKALGIRTPANQVLWAMVKLIEA